MKFSIVIPAHNEEGCIASTLEKLIAAMKENPREFEIVVVNDHCTDNTAEIVSEIAKEHPEIRLVKNENVPGFGMAVRAGLDHFTGDAVTIFMADASDSPEDVNRYFDLIEKGAECVFGSRFIKGGKLIDYPVHKLVINRMANWMIRMVFRHGLNDTTNAFKCYRREVINGCRPLMSRHFNLTIELPLKTYLRGYKFEIIPISWTNRQHGISKLRIREMGSRYLFIMVYCWLEKWLTGKDYHRQ